MNTDRMVLLHPYAPGVWPERQQATWEALAAVSRVLCDRVWDLACAEANDYAIALNMIARASTPVVVVERVAVPEIPRKQQTIAGTTPDEIAARLRDALRGEGVLP